MRLFPAQPGSPRHDHLVPLDRLAEPNWQEGQMVSLAATGTDRISDFWTLRVPAGLYLGLGSAHNAGEG